MLPMVTHRYKEISPEFSGKFPEYSEEILDRNPKGVQVAFGS